MNGLSTIMTSGTPTIAAKRMARNSLGFRATSARASSRARLLPQSRFSTTRLRLASAPTSRCARQGPSWRAFLSLGAAAA